jgi:hypothetical protein
VSVRRPRPVDRVRSSVSTHDLLLALVPVPALLGMLSGGAVGEYAGALASLALVFHGLFVAPPGGATGRSE